jgi:Spy/CpxP family protein refolding chaperone
MFGFVIAGVSLIGLVYLNRRRRGFGYGGYRLLRHLDASPAQEQVIRTVVLDLKALKAEIKAQSRDSRHELSQIFSANEWDELALDRWLMSRKADLEAQKPRFFGLIKQIHEVLDPEQRAKIGRWIQQGPCLARPHCHRHAC